MTVGEIARTAMSLSTADPEDLGANSILLERVIDPAVRKGGETFLAGLDSITVEQICETAEKPTCSATRSRPVSLLYDPRYLPGAGGTDHLDRVGPSLLSGADGLKSALSRPSAIAALLRNPEDWLNREAP